MNRIILLGVILLTQFSLKSYGQQVQGKDGIISNPTAVPCSYLGETEAWRSIQIDTTIELPITKHPKLGYHPKGDWYLNPNINPNALPKNGDPIVQQEYSTTTHRSTQVANWEGIVTNTNPGDPAMDVGPNHVVQMMNGGSGARVQIWDKSGTSLLGPSTFSTMAGGTWSGLGDPIVVYDERADRWVLTEFCSGCNDLYIAVSTTPDPLGTYYLYSVTANSFPDYPKYSIWDNSYVITANEGTTTSSVYILDRTSMLAGGGPNAQRFTVPRFGTIGFQATTPVSLMGTTASGTPALLMRMRDDAWTGSATDALEMWELDINWASPGAATLSQVQTIAVSPHETELCGYTSFACIPQQGSGTTLDPLRELLMNRVMYRNFGSHESIVCAHVTDVDGSDLAGIRWYELRRTGGGSGTWTLYQEGTYSPSDGLHRWMPTIGISASGNIGLAYNVSSSSIHPEIRYTGRKECDPLGVMTETEVQLVDGTNPNNSNRWGDYNAMGVDPSDGETFWFTATYNPANQARSRIGAFTIDPCNPQVQFDNSTYSVNESDANTVNGCLDYYTLDVPISIGIDPSQPADITINVTGGTATQNVDYTISNTNLTLDGSTLTGSAQILIYNDNYTEGNETITLDYTLNANGGDAVAGSLNQTVTITIIDDDLDPLSMPGVTTTIYSEDFESGFGGVTTNNPSGDTPFQLGNVGTTPNGAYEVPNDNTTEFAWIDDDDCDCDQDEVYLYLPSQDLTNYLSANITFDSYFEDNTYNGDNENADLVVSTDGGTTFTTIAPLVASGIDVSWTAQSFDVSAYVGNSDVIFAIVYSDAGGWLYGCSVDNFELTGELPIDIQQAVNTGSGQTANLGPNETVHFYDPTSGDVMLSLVNTSSFDYGCVTVEVDRDGTTPTALEFASAPVADYLHGKTYTVTPTNSNPSGTFDVTLYYKEAEVAAWETITGNSRNNLEVVKVAGNNRIDDVTPANYTSYTIDNIPATLGAFYSDVTLTASFANGFSGFGAGIYNVTTVTVTHTASGNDPLCNGANSGSITFTPSGGTGPYEYSVDGGSTWSSSNPVTGLASGTYSTVVRDAGMNQSTPVSVTLNDPSAITMSSTATDPNCSTGTGSITISASGGTGSLQYSINGGSTFQPGNSFTGLSGGTYNIVVEDINGCQVAGAETIIIPSAVIVASTSTVENCGNGDGTITITASGGTGSLQYSINGGSTFQPTSTFGSLTSGTYNIVVEDVNGCQATTTENVGLNTGPTITSVADNDITCFGGNDGSITFSASGVATLQYSIDGGFNWQTSNSFTNLTAATYNLYLQDGAGCQLNVGTLTLTQPSQITYTSSSSDETCGNGDGSLTLSGAGGTGSLQYSINGGATFQPGGTFSGLSTGSYNVVIQDAAGCQITGTESVGTIGGPTITNETSSDLSCNGAGDGTISITATGVATLEYSIDGGSNFGTSSSFSGLNAGTYDIVVQDGNGCTTVGSSITLSEPGAITYAASVTDASCGGSDGQILLTGAGGSGALEYSINGGSTFQPGGTFSGLSTGSYNIVVQDASGCQGTGTESVGSTSGPTITNESSTDVSCNGAADGSITISATGVATLEYSIDGGANYSTSGSFNGLSGGTYNITVRDGNGCVTNGSTLTIDEESAITFVANVIDATCGGGNGSIILTAAGGVGSYQYSINGGGSFQTSGSFTSLSDGTYNIVVEDGAGCQATSIETVNTTSGPVISNETVTDISCNGSGDGSITITATGTGTLNYSIDGGSNFSTSNSFTGLSAGSYDVVVEDGSGCSTIGSTLTINEPNTVIYAASVTDASCGSSDGSITITASGGTGALQYSVDGGTTFQLGGMFSGLPTGSYNIIVEDINGCQATGTESIGTTSGPTITNEVSTDITCNGDDDGTITISASGTGSLDYSINGGATFTGSGVFTNLSAGTYNIVVRDGNGCVTNGSTINIAEPTVISFVANITDATCGVNDGEIDITATGGTGTLQYSIDGGANFQSSGTFSSIGTGSYNVVVEDANGCQQTSVEAVNSVPGPSILNSATTDISCFGLTDGMITIVATGIAPLSYSIDGGISNQPSGSFPNLSAGTYVVTVEDNNGCITNSSSLTITEPSAITIASSTTDATCGNLDGSITLTAAGGTGTYEYSIDGGANFQPSAVFGTVMAGTYAIVVQDDNGCQATSTVNVINADGPVITSLTATDETCFGNNDGIVNVTASGTSPISYSFNGSAYQSSGTYSGVTGLVSIDVQDGNGCVLSSSITVNSATELLIATNVEDAVCGQDNGVAYVTATGGTGTYSYLWSDPAGQTNNVATNLGTGVYQVTVTDGNGCSDSTNVTVSSSSTMTVNVEVTHESCPGEEDGIISTQVAGGQAPYAYSWSNGDSTAVIENLAVGDYTLTVSDADECIVTLIIPIENEGGDCIHIPTAISPNGDGANDTWVIGGLDDYPEATVEVYNRWGSLLFSSNDYQNDWDATYGGENISAGVYYYVITLDEETTYTGSITVIR